jgi:DinB superfamily
MRRFTGKLLILTAVFCVLAAIAAAQDKAADKPAVAAASGVPGVRGEFLDEVAYYEQRFTRLAEAIPADKYTWRPAEGVRSIGEVYAHVVSANYGFAKMLGTDFPAGLDPKGIVATAGDKAKIVQELKDSFAHARCDPGHQGFRSGQIAEVAGEQAVHGTRNVHFYHRALWRASGPINCVCAANRDRSALDGRKNEAGSGEAEAVGPPKIGTRKAKLVGDSTRRKAVAQAFGTEVFSRWRGRHGSGYPRPEGVSYRRLTCVVIAGGCCRWCVPRWLWCCR